LEVWTRTSGCCRCQETLVRLGDLCGKGEFDGSGKVSSVAWEKYPAEEEEKEWEKKRKK
jgi:hypothetical protein